MTKINWVWFKVADESADTETLQVSMQPQTPRDLHTAVTTHKN